MKKILLLVFLSIYHLDASTAWSAKIDRLYGRPSLPLHIKYYEVDAGNKVMLNPYLQVATKKNKAVLDPACPAYNWVIDVQGYLRVISIVPHPRGRKYSGSYTRPEDGYTRTRGYIEKYGHVSALAGGPGRIGGEIINDFKNKNWVINNKSGRYSRGNPDRLPRQLLNAAALIRSVVEGGGQEWGAVVYLLDYAPKTFREQQLSNPLVRFGNPETKHLPYLLLDFDW
ncbi:MAG: hypothetical protein MI863_25200 [Desulfobacterales bacterium]|nr:hypothetical protein [Desulfobacterales bacterium]